MLELIEVETFYGRKQVLGIQDSPFHQKRSNLSLHDLGSLLA